jgi:hypothetical protein
MSKEWTAAVAAAEAAALRTQDAEDAAQERFKLVRAETEVAGRPANVVDTPEFRSWMAARHASDEAWGAWAMIMDAKPAS